MKNFEVDISNNPKAKMRLRNACENAKKHLSNSEEYTFDIENLAEGTDFNFSINRMDFEVACQELFSRCISCVEQSLIYANLKKEDINDIALVGSSTRIPKMKEMILNYFSKPIQNDSKYFNISINPEEAVAIGASYQIASINNFIGDKQLILNDIVSLPIVIQGQKTISTIFKRGIHIPCKDTKEIKNEIGNDKITIKINQENMTLKKEKSYSLIGEYSIENLDPKIENTFKFIFSIDVNSILSVEATDMKGQKVNLKVKEYYKLKEEDIQKMIKEVNRLNGHIKNQEEISQINHKLKKKFENNLEKKNTIDKFIENKEKDYIPIDEYKKQIKDELKIDDIMFLEK
jgi:heat shock protein 5